MSGIFNGIQKLIELIVSPMYFIIDLISEITKIGELIFATITEITTNLLTLPNWLYGYVILSVSVIVLMRMVGRGTK